MGNVNNPVRGLICGGISARRVGGAKGLHEKRGDAGEYACANLPSYSNSTTEKRGGRAGIDNPSTPANNETNETQRLTLNTTMPNWVRISSIMAFALMAFALSFVIGMALVSWYEIGEVQNDTALATTIAIIVKGQAVSVLATALGGVIEENEPSPPSAISPPRQEPSLPPSITRPQPPQKALP